MSLSKEQQRKITERMDWLSQDMNFIEEIRKLLKLEPGKETTPVEDLFMLTIIASIEIALRRLETEKVAITGKGRYQDQVDELVSNSDAFFKHYDKELKQIGLSVFRFVHRVLEDHLGPDKTFTVMASSRAKIMQATVSLLDNVRLLVLDNKQD